MTDRKLYQQQKQAQLDQWKAEIDGFKAKVAGMSADARVEADKHLQTVEKKLEEGKNKLGELAKAGDDAWEAVKGNVETAWGALKDAVRDVSSKLPSGSKTPAQPSASKPVTSKS